MAPITDSVNGSKIYTPVKESLPEVDPDDGYGAKRYVIENITCVLIRLVENFENILKKTYEYRRIRNFNCKLIVKKRSNQKKYNFQK